jgi:hypothetical protein
MKTAGQVLMRELITYELEKRRAQISPLHRMEGLGVACFSRICDFASSITSHEISPATETPNSPATHVWLPRGALSGRGRIRGDPPRR